MAESKQQPVKAPRKKPATRKVGSKKPTVREVIDKYGIDKIASHLADGTTMTKIAADIGVSIGYLSEWIAAIPERSVRAREARIHAARIWDEKAIETIEAAEDAFQLTKARELAQHYRWRASKTAPKDYGDKITNEHTGADGGALQVHSTVTFVMPPARSDDEA